MTRQECEDSLAGGKQPDPFLFNFVQQTDRLADRHTTYTERKKKKERER